MAVISIWWGYQGYAATVTQLSYSVATGHALRHGDPLHDKIQLMFRGREEQDVYVSNVMIKNTGGTVIDRWQYRKPLVVDVAEGLLITSTIIASPLDTMPPEEPMPEWAAQRPIRPNRLAPGESITMSLITAQQAPVIYVRGEVTGQGEIRRTSDLSRPLSTRAVGDWSFWLGTLLVLIVGASLVSDWRAERRSIESRRANAERFGLGPVSE